MHIIHKLRQHFFHDRRVFLSYQKTVSEIRAVPCSNASDKALLDMIHQSPIPALAAAAEAVRRVTGLSLFDSQLMAILSILQGNIAELPTGEGKTLAIVVAAVYLAAQGRKVHIFTFNDYLAARDAQDMRPIYNFFDLPSGYILQTTTKAQRRHIYSCPIVYMTVREAGFDLLQDFLRMPPDPLLHPMADCAIVDEADSILIDEAITPLVIAGDAQAPSQLAAQMFSVTDRLSPAQVEVDQATHNVSLTDEGLTWTEAQLGIADLYDGTNEIRLALLNAALQARFLLHREVDYLIKEGQVQIVDSLTGRIHLGRRYPDLLQLAVEWKEGLPHSKRSIIYNSMTIQNFLLRYPHLSGMTGSAQEAEKELYNMYGLKVDPIPPHLPSVRIDHSDCFFPSKDDRDKAILDALYLAKEKEQPVLLGAREIPEAEHISALLTSVGLHHSLLTAKDNSQEAQLIAHAGEPGRITISTNMAGRGVDIRLGGPDERLRSKVLKAGGLYVIGVGLNDSRRIDRQLRGRAGRQGDPGESRFFLCPEDPLFETYGISKHPRNAQIYAEGADAEIRYMLERYALILEEQRRIITTLREEIYFGTQPMTHFQREEPFAYERLCHTIGAKAVEAAERRLTLLLFNQGWTDYLESMACVRDGIHLSVIGGKNPLEEYRKIAVRAFAEMRTELQKELLRRMKACQVTANGLVLPDTDLVGATTTWSYQLDDSAGQFCRLPALIRSMSNIARETLLSQRKK